MLTEENDTSANTSQYKQRINAWVLYDWADSSFALIIMTSVLPVYYSQIAGVTLPSAATATAYWGTSLTISLLISALISPVLGLLSDLIQGKKRLLAYFAGIGIIATSLLVFVNTGDWLLASILFIIGRTGFASANVLYDALLPHIALSEDQDRVSSRGFAMGYLGGGLLLIVNIIMIVSLPTNNWGYRLSFLSVSVWWAIFTLPLLKWVKEPVVQSMGSGGNLFYAAVERLRDTANKIKQYRELVKYLVALLIYLDGVGIIVLAASIYGAELGLGSTELLLAVLLVQFLGAPYSLIFGRLPDHSEKRRPVFLALILLNLILTPIVGILAVSFLPGNITGGLVPLYRSVGSSRGQGVYFASDDSISYGGEWEQITIPEEIWGGDTDISYLQTAETDAGYIFRFYGQRVTITYSMGPDHGIWEIYLNDLVLLDENGSPVVIDAYSETERYDAAWTLDTEKADEYTISLKNTNSRNSGSGDNILTLVSIEVLPPIRQSNLLMIFASLATVQVFSLVIALAFGPRFLSGAVAKVNAKTSIILALLTYVVIALWAAFINSVLEFWYMASLLAMVQGGCFALTRSLYASMSPRSQSGQFFGFFSIMSKFSALVAPIVFTVVTAMFDSSRPAIFSIIVFLLLGGFLLTRVDIDKGREVAKVMNQLPDDLTSPDKDFK